MAKDVEHFYKLFSIELEYLMEDIQNLESYAEQRLKRAEITDYVFKENRVIFESEIRALQDFLPLVKKTELCGADELSLSVACLKDQIKTLRLEKGFPEAIEPLIFGKMDKIVRFIEST